VDTEREGYQLGQPLDAGTRWITLTDDAFVEDAFGLTRVVGSPVKHERNPVLRDAGGLPVVLRDDDQGCFHMWTQGHDREAWEHQFVTGDFSADNHFYPYFVRYARSQDGISWEEPDLGLVTDPKGRWGNIVETGDWRAQSHHVWFNPDPADTDRRFLMTYKDRPRGGKSTLLLASSADGLRFRTERETLWYCSDGAHHPVYDDERQRWLLYTRPANRALVPKGAYQGFNVKRRVAVHVGTEPWDWSYGRGCIFPEEEVEVADIDFASVFKHGTHFVAFLTMMDMTRQGLNEVHLAVSRDGFRWTRFPHRPVFLPRGEDGAFDAGQVHTPCVAGVYDGSVRLYYTGTPDAQKVPNSRPGGIGMAHLREGRWTGVNADQRGGYLLSRELLVTGERLELNFQPHDSSGYVRVRLLQRDTAARPDTPARVVEGCDFTDCQPVCGDVTREAVGWRGEGTLTALEGQAVYVHIHVFNGTLFGMRFAPCC
jgi:hypothetical protein